MLYACLGREPSGGRKLLRIGLLPARADLVRLVGTSIVLGLLSLLTPIAAQAIFTRAVPEGDRGQVLGHRTRPRRSRRLEPRLCTSSKD